ncbi:MAG TPA: DMT family transporter [Beijerinckiaceae bacterium]|jgi:S-adenosylmethionine uptake transporter
MSGLSPRAVAALEAVAGIALLSVMDALIKGVAARVPVLEIAFARYLFGSLAIGVIWILARPGRPSWETVRANGLRALLVVVTATSFFYALSTLPLAETLALSFLSPIFVALFASALLKERVEPRVLAALAAGFVGMAVIVGGKLGSGTFQGVSLGVAAVLLSAVTYGLSMVQLRARAQQDPVVTIVLIQNLGPGLVLVGPAAWVWTAPAASDWALLALIGGLGVAGHLLMARAYAKAEAARLASLEYTALLWAVLLGYAAYGEIPTAATLGGAALIVGGALLASRR